MLGNYLQQTTSADDIFRCIFFLGALRINIWYSSIITIMFCCPLFLQKFLFITLTLKAPRKNASEKWRLLKSSAVDNCLTLLTNLSIEANRVDLDQTAPIGSVSSGSTLFAIELLKHFNNEKSRRLLLQLTL